MVLSNPAIPAGSIVAVTGINGYIGSHVANECLKSGFKVRGVVRNATKSAWLKTLFAKHGDAFSLFEVADMFTDGGLDEAFAGVAGVAHVASPVVFETAPDKVVGPAVQGALTALKAAKKSGTVKRFVLTSSSRAATLALQNEVFTVSADSWNDAAVERAYANKDGVPEEKALEQAFDVYCASKVLSEKALWDFVRDEKPDFVANTVLPDTCFGTVLDPANQSRPSTAGWAADVLEQGDKAMVPRLSMHYVNVEDIARLHVAGLGLADVQNERLFGFAEPYTWNKLVQKAKELFPKIETHGELQILGEDRSVVEPKGRAEEILKKLGQPGWVGWDETLRDMYTSYQFPGTV